MTSACSLKSTIENKSERQLVSTSTKSIPRESQRTMIDRLKNEVDGNLFYVSKCY